MADSLINLDKLSEPLTKLVEVTSAGIGTLYKPFGTVRQAKADAKVKAILANSELEVLDIKQRTSLRIDHRELLRQENIEKVVSIAAKEMPEKVSSNPVDLDWSLQYFDAVQDVCDEDMQILWAKILAGEVTKPDSYSKRTLQFLKTLAKDEAEKFSNYCSFAFKHSNKWCVVLEDRLTRKMMIDKLGPYEMTQHFTAIGLLSEQLTANCQQWNDREFSYFESQYKASYIGNKHPTNKTQGGFKKIHYPIYFRNFTTVGQELFSITGAKPIENYPENLSSTLIKDAELSLIKQ